MSIIGIVGSRRRDTLDDYNLVKSAFMQVYRDGDTIVSGGCPKGGDRFAEIIAKDLNIPIKLYIAQWKLYGRSAGFQRNTFIVKNADILIACIALDRTGGTEDTIKKFRKLNKINLILV